MPNQEKLLWPYSTRAALLAAPLIWLVQLLVLGFLQSFLGWAVTISGNVLLAGLIVGLLPVGLRVIDHLASSRAVLDIRGVRIDFSQASFTRTSIELPDNIGRPEPAIADSSPMQIVSALESATAHRIVRLDLKDGNAWWMTRLLALCAGAVRVGSPKVIVFVGIKEGIDGAFLGWAFASALLKALIEDNRCRGPAPGVRYGDIYRKALWLARQLAFYALPDVPRPPVDFYPAPSPPAPQAQPEVQRYLNSQDYKKLGAAALEQILMDLFGVYRLEDPPDRLTLGRLNEQFGHCLSSAQIELEQEQEQQISALLNSDVAYVGLVRKGRYETLLERMEIERIVVRQLFAGARK